MKNISYAQAKILKLLLNYDEIRLRQDGYFFEGNGDRADGRSLLALIKRKLLRPSAYDTMPSIGQISSPVFYDDAVTEEGKKALKKFVDSLRWDKKQDWEQEFNKRRFR